METTTKVLIVEDNHDLRESVVEYLGMTGVLAVGVASAAEFYAAMITGEWSIVVVDIGLPDQSGYILVEYLRSNTVSKVIILTARSALDDRIRGYDAGADLYLTKPVDCRELAAAISSLALRRNAAAQHLTAPSPLPSQDIWSLARSDWSLVAPDGAVITLTGKEVRFLELLAATPGTSVPRGILLQHLYNRHDEYTSRSLDALVRRLRSKIQAATGISQPIKTDHAVGYCAAANLLLI